MRAHSTTTIVVLFAAVLLTAAMVDVAEIVVRPLAPYFAWMLP